MPGPYGDEPCVVVDWQGAADYPRRWWVSTRTNPNEEDALMTTATATGDLLLRRRKREGSVTRAQLAPRTSI
jgi:hypothetical protein